MRGVKGEAVLVALRTLRNEADAAISARPKGKNSDWYLREKKKNYTHKIFVNNAG
jgi:hypothetical protein